MDELFSDLNEMQDRFDRIIAEYHQSGAVIDGALARLVPNGSFYNWEEDENLDL